MIARIIYVARLSIGAFLRVRCQLILIIHIKAHSRLVSIRPQNAAMISISALSVIFSAAPAVAAQVSLVYTIIPTLVHIDTHPVVVKIGVSGRLAWASITVNMSLVVCVSVMIGH